MDKNSIEKEFDFWGAKPLGYELSQDYDLLYDLIHKGYKIAAYYEEIKDHYNGKAILRICEARYVALYNQILVGTPGISIMSEKMELKEFAQLCGHYNLLFILPNRKDS